MSRNAIVEIAIVLSASNFSFFKPMLYLGGIYSKTSFGIGTDEILLFFDVLDDSYVECKMSLLK